MLYQKKTINTIKETIKNLKEKALDKILTYTMTSPILIANKEEMIKRLLWNKKCKQFSKVLNK